MSTAFPAWDLYSLGLNGTPADPEHDLPAFPACDILRDYLDRDWLCMAQNQHGAGSTPPVAVGTAFPTRLAHGVLRGQLDAVLWLGGAPAECGLAVLCTHPTMLPGSGGQGYGLTLSTIASGNRLALTQFQDGVSAAYGTSGGVPVTVLADNPASPVPIGPFQQLRLQWAVDLVTRMVQLVGWSGRADILTELLTISWYGPTTYLPTGDVRECLYFAGTTNVTSCLFTSAALAIP